MIKSKKRPLSELFALIFEKRYKYQNGRHVKIFCVLSPGEAGLVAEGLEGGMPDL